MSAPAKLRDDLHSLRIPKEQRPAAPARAGGATRAVVVLLLLGAAGYAAYVNRSVLLAALPQRDAAAKVATLRVAPAPPELKPALTATGKIVSDHRVAVATKVSGQIVELHFEQGDRVKRGQVLARLEDVLYRARRDEAAAMLEKARATLAYQEVNLRRVEDLFKQNQASDIELADARRWHDEAVAQVGAAEAALAAAAKALADTEVVAPIDGVILERNVEVGDFVAAEGGRGANANALFALIADMNKLRVEVDVSELDIARLRDEMPCEVIPDAYKDRRYGGHVMWIDPGANYSKATVQVKVRIDGPDDYLRVEGSAQVTFLPDAAATQAAPSIRIPRSACRTIDGANMVFVVADGAVRATPVRLGATAGDRVEVLEGLREGDVIVSAGVEKLRDGQRVSP